MAKPHDCRRTHARYPLREAGGGIVVFGFPRPQDPPCTMQLRDISQSGLAFVLPHELPGLEVGDNLEDVCVRIGERELRGDMLIMHFTPDASAGSVCGALLYPREDEDLLMLRAILGELAGSRIEEPQGAATSS